MIVGAVTVIVWKNLSGGIFELYEILPGCILATIAILVFSKTQKVSPEAIKAFDDSWVELKK
jgi:sodium/proline symporter